MSDTNTPAPRPVSCLAVIAVFVLFSLFGLLAERVYLHARPPAPQNERPDNLVKNQEWRATPELRRAYLADLREKHRKQLETYAWVDQQKGIVQLPIERAMELVIAEHGGSK